MSVHRLMEDSEHAPIATALAVHETNNSVVSVRMMHRMLLLYNFAVAFGALSIVACTLQSIYLESSQELLSFMWADVRTNCSSRKPSLMLIGGA